MNWKKYICFYRGLGLALIPLGDKAILSYAELCGCVEEPASEAQLHKWFYAYPEASIGAMLGRLSNNVMSVCGMNLNISDPIIKNFRLTETFSIKTFSGETHFLYRFPFSCNSSFELCQGISLLGEGRHCLLPPSRDGYGARYQFLLHQPINPAPEWLKKFVEAAIDCGLAQKA